MKLIEVHRALEIYRRSDNEFVSETPLHLSLTQLKDIVTPKPDDDQLYLSYKLNFRQVEKLLTLMELPFSFDFEWFFYVLECEGIYE